MLFSHERIQRLNNLEFNVYKCIVDMNKKVLTMKIRDLADASHVSTTVVLNFCKKLDCDGWTAFKMKYKEELQKVRSAKSNELMTQQIMDYLLMHVQDIKKQDQLDEVVALIYKSRRIIFIGAGPSGVLANYASLYFNTMGKSAQHIDSPYFPIPEEDYSDTIVIALSVSGETENVIQRLNRLKALRATIISITNDSNNTISKISDISMTYSVPSEEFYVAEKLTEIHVTATTQVPVLYMIELMGKKLYQLRKSGSSEIE